MARRTARDLTVGSVFALALIILAVAVMVVGGEAGPWFQRVGYRIVFPDATGLLVGAPVRMAGVQVGIVTRVRLPTDPEESGIGVEIGIASDYAGRVRTDSRAALRILQFLTNEKYVEIVPGSADTEPLGAGSRIPRLIEVGVVERGEAIADDLGEVTVALKNILGAMERGEGLIGEMLLDPEFGKPGLAALGNTLSNVSTLTDDLVAGKGALGRLLYDESLATKLDSLGESIDDLSSVARALANREGAVGQLLEQNGTAQQALVDLQQAAASFRRLAARLESDEGLLGRLLNDPGYSSDVEKLLGDLSEIADKINRGEGTLGLLVNERMLHDGAEDIVAGTNDSKFARWLTRRYRKKGVQAEERAAAKEDEDR